MSFNYNDPLIYQLHSGQSGDEFEPKTESYKIINNKILLDQLPVKFNRITISGYVEVNEDETEMPLTFNQFSVNYTIGIVSFSPTKEGQTVTVNYTSRGAVSIPSSRIWTQQQDGEVTQTLADLIEAGESAILSLEEINTTITNAENATMSANTAALNIVTIESDIENAEALRINAENSRISAELSRLTVESTRVSQESVRESSETIRTTAESNRENSENSRESAESGRNTQESIRQNQEVTRLANTAIAISNAETATGHVQQLVNTFVQLGEYNPHTSYVINNCVRSNGSTWRCNQDSLGNTPVEGMYWTLIAQKGTDGTGLGTVTSVTSANADIFVEETSTTPTLTLNSSVSAAPDTLVKRDGSGYIIGVETPTGAQAKANQAEADANAYTDQQIQLVTETGIPKLITYELEVIASTLGQTQVNIPLDTFEITTDSIRVRINRAPLNPSDYSITNAVRDELGTITTYGFITLILSKALAIGDIVVFDVYKNAPIGEDGAISGAVIAADSLPQNRVVGLVDELSTIDDNITSIQDKLDSNLSRIPTTLQLGTNVYNITNYSVLGKLEMDGRTLVNLLGKKGNCESTDGWSGSGVNTSLDTTYYTLGINSIKITSYSTSSGYIYIDIFNRISVNKNYLLAVDVKSVTSIGGLMAFFNTGSTEYLGNAVTSSTSEFQLTYKTISPVNAERLWAGIKMNGGTSGQYGLMDALRVYEITSADKAYIDSLSVVNAQSYIAKKYPYVDSMQSIFNPYVINEGKNLVPPFSKWTIHANATMTSDYTLLHNALTTTSERTTLYNNPVAPNTTYTFSFVGSGKVRIQESDVDRVYIKNTIEYSGEGTYTFTTTANTYLINFDIGNNSIIGAYTFSNLMLNLGSVALPFEPQNKSYLFMKESLRSNIDETVKDKLYQNGDGEYRKIKRFEERDIADLNQERPPIIWGSATIDGTGHKIIRTTNLLLGSLIPINSWELIKNDGSIICKSGTSLVELQAKDKGDHFYISNGNELYVSVWDYDSGWGEMYNPTLDEIAAYPRGWKMNNGTFGTAYSGTGTKTWVAWDAINNTGAVTVTPTTPSTAITSGVNDYYKVQYQLATPVDFPVEVEGTLEVFEGANQVTVGAGVIVRESANPNLVSGNYYINRFQTGDTSLLSQRAKSMYHLYKDGNVDNTWTIETSSTGAYGVYRARIANDSFDILGSYSVTYLALDMYSLGIAPYSISAEYQGNLATVVQSNVSDIVDAKTQISVIKNQYARKQQGQWIAPTLLNSWVNYNAGFHNAGYFIDEFGFVNLRGMIRNGAATSGTALFYLPVGYRPSVGLPFGVISYDGTNHITGRIDIEADGKVEINAGANSFLSFNGIRFRAEQ